MTDLSELKRLAKAATPGEWFVAPNGSAYYGSEPAIFSTEKGQRGQKICSAHWGFGTKGGQADYYFIAAANPATILSLIKRVEEAEAREREALKRAADYAREAGEWKGRYTAAGYTGTLDGWIARAEKAEAALVKQSLTTAEAHARGVAEGLERAAKVADGYVMLVDPEFAKKRDQEAYEQERLNSMARSIAAAIRKGE